MIARRIRHVMALAGSLLLIGACDTHLPTGPSDLTTGITIYEHSSFQGKSAFLDADVSDLSAYSGPCTLDFLTYSPANWAMCISSIKVARGWRATVYSDPDFKGESLDVTADVPDLSQVVPGPGTFHTWNDCIRSIRVSRQ